jgi:hypothetical protein
MNPSPSTKPKLHWNKCDTKEFSQRVQDILPADTLYPIDPPNIEAAIATISQTLVKAAEATVPSTSAKLRKRKCPWSEEANSALKSSKDAMKAWKKAGKPGPQHPLSITRRSARKLLRRTIRINRADSRNNLYNKIMESGDDNQNLMYKLIAKQRHTNSQLGSVLRVNGQLITDPDQVLEVWAEHYEQLGTPLQVPHFNDEYKKNVEYEVDTIQMVLSRLDMKSEPFTTEETINAIKKLNNNKASDSEGVSAEHLKHSITVVANPITSIFNGILNTKYIPDGFREGTQLPIHKKGKDHLCKDNFRGIVLNSVIGKAFEHAILAQDQQKLEKDQSEMQFGFTQDVSPIMAALVVTEAIAEGADTKKPVFMAAIDTQKAFDVVWRDSLHKKLFKDGIHNTWQIHKELLTDTVIKVRLGNLISRPVCVNQGIGQGKILAAYNYKKFINPIMQCLSSSGIGLHIGTIYCGCPGCADDLVFLSDTAKDLQLQFHVGFDYSADERYIIHPTKTKIEVVYGPNKSLKPKIQHEWQLGPTTVHPGDNCTHLGIDRYPDSLTSETFISDKIKLARRTAYSLMGAGFHGTNGLSPSICRAIYTIYVQPRLLYGLECMVLKRKHYDALELYHRGLIRRLASLPERTAKEAIYLALGIPPIEATLDIRMLNLYGMITNRKNSVLRQVAIR